MPDQVTLFRRQQLYRRVYDKRIAAITKREYELRAENAVREEIANNMKDFVATAMQCRFRGWQGRCVAAVVRQRHYAAVAIQRIGRGYLARRLAAHERRKMRQVLSSPVALQLLIARSTVLRTVGHWQELVDSHTNEYFYYHVYSHDSQWLPPEPYEEFLLCQWPECGFVGKTIPDMHEHYRTLHVWYCPVCMAKVATSTFPRCPICQSVCSHDPKTGELLGPGETKLLEMQRAKEAEEEIKREKEAMQRHRMQQWAELVNQDGLDHGRRRRRKRLAFGRRQSPTKTTNAPGSVAPAISEEDSAIAALQDVDADVVNVRWISSIYGMKKERGVPSSKLFAKTLLPLGSLYVGDFHKSSQKFDGLGEIFYANGGHYIGGWKDNIRTGKGIYQGADGSEYIGEWLDGKRHGMGILTMGSGERYFGQFVDGHLDGLGVLHAANGDKYAGGFSSGRPNGQGKFKKVNGDKFIGSTIDGEAHGIGILSTADGEVYKGEWDHDYRHGRGVCFYPNGAVYSGEWWRGRWAGHGVYISSEGIKYIGEFLAGEKHGKGKLIFENGDLFDGHFVHGVAEGHGDTKGIYRFHDSGNMYIGGWANNKREGKGTYIFRDGSQFTGYFHDDHAHGKGKMVYSNGNTYEGDFEDAEKHGKGIYRWKNGSVYDGEFAHGVIHGYGRIEYASGHKYDGQWVQNKKHGRGRFDYKNGDVYEGDWDMDRRHGKGKFVWGPGTSLEESYEGDWVYEKRHGVGTYRYTDGTSYTGDWVQNTRQGTGTFTWPNGDVYRGGFDREMQHGFGSFYDGATGNTYEGEWVYNVREGPGRLLYASGKVFQGTFHEGRRHGAGVMTYPDGNSYHGSWNQDKKQGGGRYILRVSDGSSQGDSKTNAGETLRVRVFGY